MRPSAPALILLLLGASATTNSQDTITKLEIHSVMMDSSSEQTVYIEKNGKRTEYRSTTGRRSPDGSVQRTQGPRMAMITRCDLGKIFDLNLDAKTYSSSPYPPKPFTPAQMKGLGISVLKPPISSKPTLRIETTTVDTGGRKQMFGYTARHVIITTKRTPLAGSHSQPQVSVTDGWFIDFRPQFSCQPLLRGAPGARGWLTAVKGKQIDVPEFIDHGKRETGYPVQEVNTITGEYAMPDGSRRKFASKFERSVTIEKIPADPALFEVPAGFRHVEHVNPEVVTPAPRSLWQRIKRMLAGE